VDLSLPFEETKLTVLTDHELVNPLEGDLNKRTHTSREELAIGKGATHNLDTTIP
jgi:hypothetical protein